MHLNEGKADDGTQVVLPESLLAMREPQVDTPDLGTIMAGQWGLGWMLFDWDGGKVIGHDGGTIGQSSFLRVAPEHGVAIALLTNGGEPLHVYQAIFGKLMAELAGIQVPPLPAPDSSAAPDLSRFVGEYSSMVADTVVTADDEGRLWMERTPKGIFAEIGGPSGKEELLPYRGDTFVATVPMVPGVYLPHAFVGDDGNGHVQFLHTGRADRRVSA